VFWNPKPRHDPRRVSRPQIFATQSQPVVDYTTIGDSKGDHTAAFELDHVADDVGGVMTKPLHAGQAARNGILAVQLAGGNHCRAVVTCVAAARRPRQFSGPYLAAYTLVHGAPMLAAFTEEALHDAVVRAFARKVSLVTYEEYADVLDESPAKVTITLAGGRKMERAKYYPTGSVQAPMTKARIEDKFTTCATTAIQPDAAKKVLAMLSTLGEQPSFDDFWPLLSKG